tara:strand:+ start:40 stop:246 length:207 start_codon:yes stop_codon:yes gene_type:complete
MFSIYRKYPLIYINKNIMVIVEIITNTKNHTLREIQSLVWNLEFDKVLTTKEAKKITSMLQSKKDNIE